jgi:hypothetical protein
LGGGVVRHTERITKFGCTMQRNAVRPYCSTALVEAENRPESRSIEHLIPNTALSRPRTKRDGDFFACRKCNGRKSHIDYVLSIIANAQSADSDLAANTLISAITSDDGRAQRFNQMAAEAKDTSDGGAMMNIPVFAQELLEYISFLGRGQYFRKRSRPFDQGSQVMIVDFINKPVMAGRHLQQERSVLVHLSWVYSNHRELLRHARMRADRPAQLADQDRGAHGAVHLHRGLVQPAPPAQRTRADVAGQLRKEVHRPQPHANTAR